MILSISTIASGFSILAITRAFEVFFLRIIFLSFTISSALRTNESPIHSIFSLRIKAKSFLHNQVRIIAGTLMMVGKEKWKITDIKRALKAKQRGSAGQTAPAWGLFLYSIKY